MEYLTPKLRLSRFISNQFNKFRQNLTTTQTKETRTAPPLVNILSNFIMFTPIQLLPLKNRLDNVHVVEVLRCDEVFIIYGKLVGAYHVGNGGGDDSFTEAGNALVDVHDERFQRVFGENVQDQLVGG